MCKDAFISDVQFCTLPAQRTVTGCELLRAVPTPETRHVECFRTHTAQQHVGSLSSCALDVLASIDGNWCARILVVPGAHLGSEVPALALALTPLAPARRRRSFSRSAPPARTDTSRNVIHAGGIVADCRNISSRDSITIVSSASAAAMSTWNKVRGQIQSSGVK